MLNQTRQQLTGTSQQIKENVQANSKVNNVNGHLVNMKNKQEEESASDPSHNTSPTNKLPTDQSTFFPEEKRKCPNCADSQRIIASLEGQLNQEKKKIAKYSRIIQAKVDKQKQLQLAYSQIAKQMKKKMELALKNQPLEQISNIIVRQNQQISQDLKRVQEQLAQKISVIQMPSDKICSQSGSSALLKIQRRRQNMSLQRQVTNVNICQGLKQSKLSIFHYSLPLKSPYWKLKESKNNKFNNQQCQEQTSEQKCLNIPKNGEDSMAVQNYVFDKHDNSCGLSSYQFNEQSILKEKDNRDSIGSQLQFKTVNEMQESQSFHSVYSGSRKIIQFQEKAKGYDKKIQVGSQFHSIHEGELSISGVSNVQIYNNLVSQQNRKSDHEWLDNIINKGFENDQNERQSSKMKESKDNNILCKDSLKMVDISQTFKIFMQDLNDKFNPTGRISRPSYNFPNFMLNVVRKVGNVANSSLNVYEAIEKTQFQGFLSKILIQLQNLLRIQKKQYEKMLNNNKLQLSNQQAKLEEEKAQRQRLEKMIEGYQYHKSLFDINLLQQQAKDRSHLVSETKIIGARSELLTSVQKKLTNIKQSKMRNESVECSIISTDILDKYKVLEQRNFQLIDALSCISKMLSEIHKDGQYNIDFEKGLNQQIQSMLKGFIESMFVGRQMESTEILMRARSSGACVTPSLNFPSKKSDSIVGSHSLQNENHQFRNHLKQKNQEILKLSQKNTLQNMEIVNRQKIIQNLRIQIYSLNDELKTHRIDNSHSKHQNRYMLVGSMPIVNESPSKSSQFMDFEEKQQYNNLYWDRDQQLRDLRQKVANYELQIKKCRREHKKKKKLIYINN